MAEEVDLTPNSLPCGCRTARDSHEVLRTSAVRCLVRLATGELWPRTKPRLDWTCLPTAALEQNFDLSVQFSAAIAHFY